ncbi:MAG TPA: cytochrome c [Bryobacteraceae bacterium]|nr:cytochrome c [Bryobacteraceae bacterium]
MKFLSGFILALLLGGAAVYGYFKLGYAPVATAATPIPFEMTLAHLALHVRIDKDAPKTPPFQPAEADLQNGAQLYREHCAVCHGLPGQAKSAVAQGMYPKPPELLRGKGVTDDPAGETYWKVAHGIRLTGMPSYSASLSDKEMWQISFLLAGADKLPAAVQEILKKPLPMN